MGGPFSIPPAGGAFPVPIAGLPGIPTDGGWNTVDAARHGGRADSVNRFMFSGGPAGRFVYDPIPDGVRAGAIWPGGTSGVLGSSFYSNLLDLWLTNDTLSLRVKLREILRAIDRVELFLPGAAGAR
jgi:penicillin amidase